MHHFLTLAGRNPLLVNLDPAAEDSSLPLAPDVDVRDLVCLSEAMERLGLGPNGGLAWCMDYIAENADWLRRKIREAIARKSKSGDGDAFLIIDTPGQAELFSPGPHGSSMLSLISSLSNNSSSNSSLSSSKAEKEKENGREEGEGGDDNNNDDNDGDGEDEPPLHLSLAAVLLLDSHLCTDSGKYLAGLLTALGAMLHLELPQINVLSKVDNLRAYSSSSSSTSSTSSSVVPGRRGVGEPARSSALQFDIAHYASASGLRYLLRDLTGGGGGRGGGGSFRSDDDDDDENRTASTHENNDNDANSANSAFASRYAKLTRGLCEVVEDFGLLSFTPLAVEDEACVRGVATLVDRAVGWVPEAAPSGKLPSTSSRVVPFAAADRGAEALLEHVREKYLGGGGEDDDLDVGDGDGGDDDEYFDDDDNGA